MALFQTYSKEKNGFPEKLIYDSIPVKVRNQIFHIWNDFFSQRSISLELRREAYSAIYDTIIKEHGLKTLITNNSLRRISKEEELEIYFDQIHLYNIDDTLNVIQIVFFYSGVIESHIQKVLYGRLENSSMEAIDDLNKRFKENGIGYEFNNGKIIRIDNQILHKESVQPALQLSNEPDFINANEEYSKALEHLRYGRNPECLNECLKAFETVMKIICSKNKWVYKERDTASVLINIILSNNFLDSFNESQLNAMNQLLESGIPTIRNKKGAHGQGIEKVIVPDSLANYMVYITGSTIRLFIETHLERKK